MAQLKDTTVTGTLDVSSKINAQAVELSASQPYIDFHYNNSTADYTARIIHSATGCIDYTTGTYGSIVQNGATGYVYPATSGNYGLGSSDYRWYGIYLQNAPNVSSLVELKENIRPFTNALDEIDKTDVFNYNLKECIKRDGEDIDHTGFIIGDGYNISELLLGHEGNGIDMYNAIGVTFGGIKELYEIVKKQQTTIENLKSELEILKQCDTEQNTSASEVAY